MHLLWVILFCPLLFRDLSWLHWFILLLILLVYIHQFIFVNFKAEKVFPWCLKDWQLNLHRHWVFNLSELFRLDSLLMLW